MRWIQMIPLFAAVGLGATPPTERAVAAYLAGDHAGVRTALKSTVAGMAPAVPERILYARASFHLHDWDAAGEQLAIVLKADPGRLEALALQGRVMFRLGRYAEAAAHLASAVRQTNRTDLRLELAESEYHLGRTRRALAELERVIAADGTWPRAHDLLGRIHLREGSAYRAGRAFRAALRLGEPSADTQWLLARALAEQGRISGPLEARGPYLESAIGQFRDDRVLVRQIPGAHADQWYTAGRDGALYHALQAVTRATEVSREQALFLAECWSILGAPAAAAPWLARFPMDPAVQALAIEVDLAAGNLAAAATAALADAPTDPLERDRRLRVLLALARAAERDGDGALRLRVLAFADREWPGRSEVLRALSRALWAAGRKADAHTRLAMLQDLHPDAPAPQDFARSVTGDL